MAEACTKPKDLGYAAEFWSYSTLTKHIRSKAVEAGFPRLATISMNEVFSILEESKIKPHKIRYYCEKKTQNLNQK